MLNKYKQSIVIGASVACALFLLLLVSGYLKPEQNEFVNKYPANEQFYIVALTGTSIAVRQNKPDGVYQVPETKIDIEFKNGTITPKWGTATLPGYYESWAAWARKNEIAGIVLE